MAEEEKFLQEIKEPKHTDDPHDSATKDAIDGYIEIDTFKIAIKLQRMSQQKKSKR